MRHLLRTLLPALILGLLLPLPLSADDPIIPGEPDKPAQEEPEDPPSEEPTKSDPKDDEKKTDPPDILREDPEDETEPAPPVEIQWRKRTVKELLESPDGTAAPAGMVYVPAGTAVIGTPATDLAKILRGRMDSVQRQFAFETPQHFAPMTGYFIDRYEVTNAQYQAFLMDQHHVVYRTTGALANLEEITAHVLGKQMLEVGHKKCHFPRQFYDANIEVLHKTFPDLVVTDGPNPEKSTYKKFRRAVLPRDLELEFYSLVPPKHWIGMTPPTDQMDHPVRYVSYNDAAEFAEWAGKHIPTEYEWEYAARGPKGFLWPWGDLWFADVRFANWGAKIIDSRYAATSVPVDGNPPTFAARWQDEIQPYNGMSWCGVYHLLGNVAEWTSSWFFAYPGNELDHDWLGEYVKVVRGASFEDNDEVVLRLAARNYEGVGQKRPPRPDNYFKNIGFRTAWYGNAGQDQLEPILQRAASARRVKRPMLNLTRWVGATATKFAGQRDVVRNQVFVKGKTHAVVLIPLKTFLADDDKTKIKKRKELLKKSTTVLDPYPIAVFHTDVPLANVYEWDREASRKAALKDKKKTSSKRRRTAKLKAPPTKLGTLRPDTYVLAYWHERLCFCLPSLDFVAFLSKGKTPEGQLAIKKLEKERPTVMLAADPDADVIEFAVGLPLGGAKNAPESHLIVQKVFLEVEEGLLEKAGTWSRGRYGKTAGDAKPKPAPAKPEPAKPEPEPAKPAKTPEPKKPDAEKPDEAPKKD